MRPSLLNRNEICVSVSYRHVCVLVSILFLELKSFYSSLYFYTVFNVHLNISFKETFKTEYNMSNAIPNAHLTSRCSIYSLERR